MLELILESKLRGESLSDFKGRHRVHCCGCSQPMAEDELVAILRAAKIP
jgi:hypothetical protein